jgi:hypothetical protein
MRHEDNKRGVRLEIGDALLRCNTPLSSRFLQPKALLLNRDIPEGRTAGTLTVETGKLAAPYRFTPRGRPRLRKGVEPADGHVAHTVGPRDIRVRFARSKPASWRL